MKAQCETEDIYIEKEAEIPEIEILRTINENETNIGLLELLIETEKEKINKHDSRIEIEKIKNTTHMARAASAVPHQPDSTNPTHPPVLT